MRTIIFVLIAVLAGCGSDTDAPDIDKAPDLSAYALKTSLPPNEATSVAALRAQVASLQASLNKLQLIGKVPGAVAKNGIVTYAITPAVDFGPCTDMGLFTGTAVDNLDAIADPLSAQWQAFKTCTNYHVEYHVDTGIIRQAQRIFWDGPNCTGNLLEWPAGGGGYDSQTLNDGVVFISPIDGTTEYMVSGNQTPQPILIQSVWVASNPGCQSDVETQLMYSVTLNDTSLSGVPNSAIGKYIFSSP